MNNATIESLLSNSTNIACPMSLLWRQDIIVNKRSRLYTCIIATGINLIFWIQLIFRSSIREISLQWIYAYLITDIFLLVRFFFTYIVHTTSTNCYPTRIWVLFVCYFEVTVDNYFNILEVYILLALNICRYVQIVYNRNVYRLHRKLLIVIHLCIYLIPIFTILLSIMVDWTRVNESFRSNGTIFYTNIYIKIFNFIFAFGLPIFLNVLVIYMCVRDIRLKSTLQHTQYFRSVRQKYNRTLVIQFLYFYILWLAFWSPNIIFYRISIQQQNLSDTSRLLNYLGVAIDPIIISALDARMWHIWKKLMTRLKFTIGCKKPNHSRIEPLPIDSNIASMKIARQNRIML